MAGRECLDAADPGHDFELEPGAPSRRHQVQYRDRAVIQRRVPPHQEGATALGIQLLLDQPLPYLGPLRPPVLDRRAVRRRGPVAPGLGDGNRPVATIRLDVAPADLLAQRREVLDPSLDLEEHVRLVERADGPDGHVLEVAGADPDGEHPPHYGAPG